jgi:hypothetical protein
VAIGKCSVEIGESRNVRLPAPQLADNLADHAGIVPLADPISDATEVDMSAEHFPQIGAKRLFHQIHLSGARRVCSALFLFCSALGAFR